MRGSALVAAAASAAAQRSSTPAAAEELGAAATSLLRGLARRLDLSQHGAASDSPAAGVDARSDEAASPAPSLPRWDAPAHARCDPCGCGLITGAAAAAPLPALESDAAPGWCFPHLLLARSGSGGSGGGSSGATTKGSGRGGSASASSSAAAAEAPDPLAAALGSGTAAARHLTPREIVEQLDSHIVGQQDAKRAVAVALRNRWRRHQLDATAAREVVPKNILMIGPTGCGKTEIARRLAKLVDAPFVKVEATKFTELGYVGRDVDEIVKDLVEASLTLTRTRVKAALSARAEVDAEERILRDLLGDLSDRGDYETFRQLYREGVLDDRVVEVTVGPPGGGGGGPEAALVATLERLGLAAPRGSGGRRGGGGQKQKMKVRDARSLLVDREAERWLSSEAVAREAVRAAQEDGIVFIDEVDKIAARGGGGSGGGVSSEGVQRDLLPILEGSTVSTKHGAVATDHVLFIASGAFHSAKPSDLLAELQGRLPVRVELKGLTADDLHRVLTEPKNNMIRQQQALLATEGVDLAFTDGAVRAVAQAAEKANRVLDNIGARRLHTILERVLSDISFTAPEKAAAAKAAAAAKDGGGSSSSSTGGVKASRGSGSGGGGGGAPPAPLVRHVVGEEDVEAAVGELLRKQDLSKYML